MTDERTGETIKQADTWVPVVWRTATDEDREEFHDKDTVYIIMTTMPEDGEHILVTTLQGEVSEEEFDEDTCDFAYSNLDWRDVRGWRSMPRPYDPHNPFPHWHTEKYVGEAGKEWTDILISTTDGNAQSDEVNSKTGFLGSGLDWEDVTAWMPMPKPYTYQEWRNALTTCYGSGWHTEDLVGRCRPGERYDVIRNDGEMATGTVNEDGDGLLEDTGDACDLESYALWKKAEETD